MTNSWIKLQNFASKPHISLVNLWPLNQQWTNAKDSPFNSHLTRLHLYLIILLGRTECVHKQLAQDRCKESNLQLHEGFNIKMVQGNCSKLSGPKPKFLALVSISQELSFTSQLKTVPNSPTWRQRHMCTNNHGHNKESSLQAQNPQSSDDGLRVLPERPQKLDFKLTWKLYSARHCIG